MPISVKRAEEIRDELVGLDLSKEEDYQIYAELRREFIGLNEEGKIEGSLRVYNDENPKWRPGDVVGKGKLTIGIGFNMMADGAMESWGKAFSVLDEKDRPSFNEVLSGRVDLTKEQVEILYDYSVNTREDEVKKLYGKEAWTELLPNERLGILDMYYNAPVLVRSKTSFYKNIQDYIDSRLNYELGISNDSEEAKEHLIMALWEVRKYSNDEKSRGIQNRRDVEAIMLNTYNVDLDTIPTPEIHVRKVKEKARKKKQEIRNNVKGSTGKAKQSFKKAADEHMDKFVAQVTKTVGIAGIELAEPYLDKLVDASSDRYLAGLDKAMDKMDDEFARLIESGRLAGQTPEEMEAALEVYSEGLGKELTQDFLDSEMHLFQELDMARQVNFGFEKFTWVTAGDDKVRPEHEARQGDVYSWADADELPGEAPNCRCVAEPVLA